MKKQQTIPDIIQYNAHYGPLEVHRQELFIKISKCFNILIYLHQETGLDPRAEKLAIHTPKKIRAVIY